jgi:hypothetical protein
MEARINVLLDLDNTIINALEEGERLALPAYFQDKFDHKDMVPFFRIFARPYLQEFLDYLFANFNVSVFTAAEHSYAKFIIDNFIKPPNKPGRELSVVFFRYHFEISEKLYEKTKGLEILWDFFHVQNFYPCNTVIIDDLRDVKESNPYNTLAIYPFDMMVLDEKSDKKPKMRPNWDAVNDQELMVVMKKLADLKKMYEATDCIKNIYNGQPDYSPILQTLGYC